MILISDESGDTGCSYVSNASNFYIISYAIIDDRDNAINTFVDSAFRASKDIFGRPLSEWKKLTSKIKCDPDIQKEFIERFFSILSENKFYCTLGFFIINKQEIERRDNREKDKKLIQNYANDGYKLVLKRVLPFLKCYHYTAKRYPADPKLTWYIDINNKEFQSKMQDETAKIAIAQRVQIEGPTFISKREAVNREIVHAITVIDVIGGIVNKSLEAYMGCICDETNCFSSETCANTFKPVWKSILKHSSNIRILHQKKHFWDWQGIQYVPITRRNEHARFFTKDIFTD